MNKVQAKVAELKEKLGGSVGGANYRYVTYYDSIEEYADERALSVDDAYEDIINHVITIEKPSRDSLNHGFMIIEESGAVDFELVLSADILDYTA